MRFRFLGRSINSEDGNVFIAIFGAIAMVGILGASVMTFMKGPLATSVKLTKINTAENQMSMGAQVAVMATASQANNGDCETAPDGYVEPIEWRTAAVGVPKPTNGGLVPLSLGISKKDPWGTEYGYCVWNHGPSTSGAGCGANMLAGTNARIYPVVSLISAGPDKTFTTTCRSFATADANSDGDLLDVGDLPLVSKAADTDDDVITSFTYDEATGVSGGLWSIKAGSPGTATIGKNIETTGTASLKGGLLLPDKALIICDATTAGVMAKDGATIQICDGAGNWTTIGGSGASNAFGTAATCTVPADAGKVRFNSVSGMPEFCNGIGWLPFSMNIPGINLILTPSSNNAMNVDGGNNLDLLTCTLPSGFSCGAAQVFTLTNNGTLISPVLSYALTNTTNFAITQNTCTVGGGNADGQLSPNETCSITVRPRANGNTGYTGQLNVTGGNNPFAIIQGAATNFGCVVGRLAPGGMYAGCNVNNGDGTYNLVVMPGGCNGSTVNPSCGGNDYMTRTLGPNVNLDDLPISWAGSTTLYERDGSKVSVDLMNYRNLFGTSFPAVEYCDSMIYGGFSDWYLPTEYEFYNYFFPGRQSGALTGFTTAQNYWTATVWGWDRTNHWTTFGMSAGDRVWPPTERWQQRIVRCARRDNLPIPSISVDSDPAPLTINRTITFTPSARISSPAYSIVGITVPVAYSISGSGNPRIKLNGGAELASGNVSMGQTLTFVMDSPAVTGTEATATITIGPDTYSWKVGLADSVLELKAFITNSGFSSNLGGLAGADYQCSQAAAASPYGLSSSFKAMLSSSSENLSNRIPWNWGTLKTVTGIKIADGYDDLLDGSFDNPLNISEYGGTITWHVFTGSNAQGIRNGAWGADNPQSYALDWTNNSCPPNMTTSIGNSGSTSLALSSNNDNNCYGLSISNGRLYCIEDTSGTGDTTPLGIRLNSSVQVPTSSRQTSNTIKISAMSSNATTTLSVTATGGTPTFTINGGAEVTSGLVRNGDDIVFRMNAPATTNASRTMTISSSGPNTVLGTWNIITGWDGIGSGIKRVFVTSQYWRPDSFGGVLGADSLCQGRAAAASLGGTWKAILSGVASSEWAINRVGYNWSELRLVDGTTQVALAGTLWSSNLLSPIVKNEFGTIASGVNAITNTNPDGSATFAYNVTQNCNNWTTYYPYQTFVFGNSAQSSQTNWINNWVYMDGGCGWGQALYCIEQ